MPEPTGARGAALTRFRRARGLSQAALAASVGVSRQALGAVERGHALPGVDLAVRLARALGTDVETLFGQGSQAAALSPSPATSAPVRLAGKLAKGVPPNVAVPVVWAEIQGRLVLRPADVDGPVDALLTSDQVTSDQTPDGVQATPVHRLKPLPEAGDPARSVFLGGCDPAARLLAQSAEAALPGWRVHIVPMGSLTALAAFADGTLNACGLHVYEPSTGTYNEAHVADTARSLGADLAMYAYATWEEGLVWADATLAPAMLLDVAGPGVRWALRPPGSEARALWQRLAEERHWRQPRPEDVITARTHLDVTHLVAERSAQAGITLAALAVRHGLRFTGLSREPYVLVTRRDDAATRLVLERALASPALRRQVSRLPGYAATHLGDGRIVTAAAAEPRPGHTSVPAPPDPPPVR